MNDAETTFTDLDELVTVRLADGKIHVEVTAAGYRRPVNVIANLVTELAGRAPRPGAESDAALAAGIEGVGGLHRAAATGGYEDFAAMMRGRLGIEAPAETLSRDPEFDKAIADRLDGVLNAMRAAQTARAEPAREVLTAEHASDEGDIVVTSSSERAVADVWLGPDAKKRGPDGLGAALTSLIALARDDLRRLSEERARGVVPEGVAKTIDNAPEEAARASADTAKLLERINRINETIQRKAGR